MRNIIIVLTIVVATSASALGQQVALGFKLGDPSGVSAKLYTENCNYDFTLGRGHIFYGNWWVKNQFDAWYKDQDIPYKQFRYMRHFTSFPITLQGHRLHQKPLKSIGSHKFYSLDWYFGYGIQLAFQKYEYEYQYRPENEEKWVTTRGVFKDFDLGVDGVIGVEYKIPKSPWRFFAEANIMVEAYDNPGRLWFQSGFGFRYSFPVKEKQEQPEQKR